MARFTAAQLEAKVTRAEPFEYESRDGQVVTFRDPKSLHYLALRQVGQGSVDDTMKILLGDDYETFAGMPEVDGYLMEALLEAYNAHHGVPSGPE